MQNLRNPVRVGLLLDTQFAPEWIHKLIEQLLASESVELSLFVLNRTQLASLSQPKSVLFRSWKKVAEWLFRRTLPQEDTSQLSLPPLSDNMKPSSSPN